MRTFFDIAAKTAIYGMALATIASWLGFVHEQIDILSHFRLHFALFCFVLAIITLVLPSKRAALMALALSFINMAGALIYPHQAIETASASGQHLKIMTLNGRAGSHNKAKILQLIQNEKPDFVLLQEFPYSKRSILKTLKDEYPWQMGCARVHRCRLMLLSRHKWQKASAALYGDEPVPIAWARFGPELGYLNIANIHLHRPFYEAQGRQLENVIKYFVKQRAGPTIIAGDYNAAAWSHVMRVFSRRSSLKSAGFIHPTWPRHLFNWRATIDLKSTQLQIDHIMVSKEIGVTSITTSADVGSDHLALIAKVAIR